MKIILFWIECFEIECSLFAITYYKQLDRLNRKKKLGLPECQNVFTLMTTVDDQKSAWSVSHGFAFQ